MYTISSTQIVAVKFRAVVFYSKKLGASFTMAYS